MGEPPACERYRLRDLVVDVGAAEVRRGGERLVLPPRTFELLVALLRQHPALVRRSQLLETVWRDEHVSDQTLSHRVMVLRKALGDHAEQPVYVTSERGFGYRLVAPVECLPETSAATPAAAPRPARRQRVLLTAGIASTLLAAGLGIGLAVRGSAPVATAAGRTTTVAVRPLPTGSGTGLEPLASEFGIVIASTLRRQPGLRVVRWDDRARPDLWVEAHCSGGASALGLRVQLVDRRTGRPAWSGTYEGDAYQLLERESAIAAAVARAARERAAAESEPAAGEPVLSRETLRQLLRGEELWFCWSRDGLGRSAKAWQSAREAVPGLAQAHAGGSLTESVACLLGYRPPAAAARQARALARRAAELDDGLPATRLASGLVRLLFDGDLAGADTLVRAAVADDGEDARGAIVLAILALAQGRFDEASRLTAEPPAVPHATAAALLQARARQASGDWTGAAAAYERALALEPGLEAARVGRAECEARLGRPGATRALARSCAAGGVALPDATRACLASGETGRARDLLRRAVSDGWPHAVLVPRDPAYAPLGAWADFAALRAEARGARSEPSGGPTGAWRAPR